MEDLQKIFAINAARLILFIYESGYTCTLGEAYRTKEQAELYAQQGKGIRNSAHCNRMAIDLNLFSPSDKYCTNQKDYEQFGIYWEQLYDGNRWGGRFQRMDSGHFEMKDEE